MNGSPKVINSNSSYFVNMITKNLDEYNVFELKDGNYNNIIDSIGKSKTIILAFPLYVDSPTSITLAFLDYIVDNEITLKHKSIYTIINCGFREGEQNITALNIIKRWCEKVKATYKGSILIGAGEIVGNKKYKFISNKALKDLKEFSNIIKENKTKEIVTTINLLNDKIYCILANLSWNKKGRINNLTKKELNCK